MFDHSFQSMLPLLKSDLFSICEACIDGTLKECMPQFDLHKKVLGVVAVSKGYPEAYKKDLEISGKSSVTVYVYSKTCVKRPLKRT